jgi:hypothetical protein
MLFEGGAALATPCVCDAGPIATASRLPRAGSCAWPPATARASVSLRVVIDAVDVPHGRPRGTGRSAARAGRQAGVAVR